MSEATLATTTDNGGTVTVYLGEPGLPPARGAIRCEVNVKGELELYPSDALGAYFLRQFGHGEVRVVWTYRAAGPARPPTNDFERLTISCDPRPLLSSGGDPFYTGMSLSAPEQKACRELVDQMRSQQKASRPKRRPKPPKPPTSDSTP